MAAAAQPDGSAAGGSGRDRGTIAIHRVRHGGDGGSGGNRRITWGDITAGWTALSEHAGSAAVRARLAVGRPGVGSPQTPEVGVSWR